MFKVKVGFRVCVLSIHCVTESSIFERTFSVCACVCVCIRECEM